MYPAKNYISDTIFDEHLKLIHVVLANPSTIKLVPLKNHAKVKFNT